MECIELNWLCKPMEIDKTSQAAIMVLIRVKHRFSLWVVKQGHLKSQKKKLGSRLFLYSLSQYPHQQKFFFGASNLLCASCRHIHSPLFNKNYVIWRLFEENSIFATNTCILVWSSTSHVDQVNGASYSWVLCQ